MVQAVVGPLFQGLPTIHCKRPLFNFLLTSRSIRHYTFRCYVTKLDPVGPAPLSSTHLAKFAHNSIAPVAEGVYKM